MGVCLVCGKEFKDTKGKLNKFCSIPCYREHQKSGAYSGVRRTVKGKCIHCQKEVYKSFSKKRNGERAEGLFCDRVCYDAHRSKMRIIEKEKKCAHCGATFMGFSKESKYCSDQCRKDAGFAIVKEKHNVIGLSSDGKKYIKKCKICEKEFLVPKQKANHSICSKECISIFYKTEPSRKKKISKAFQGEKHPNYINGVSFNDRIRKTDIKENFSSDLKKEVFRSFGNKCFNCGKDTSLTIDHHIPFSRGGRLSLSNCVLLCKSCNSKKNAKNPEDFYSDEQLQKLALFGIGA